MTMRLTKPQAELLRKLAEAGDRGVFKSTNYTPAEMLISDGMARWAQKYHGGTGKLVITAKGREFLGAGALQ
jgi:hypothetical protein